MATNPAALLAAAGIFGQSGANVTDPRVRALFGLPPLMNGPIAAPMQAPVPAAQPAPPPVTAVPQPSMFGAVQAPNVQFATGIPGLDAVLNVNPFVNAAKGHKEWPISYGMRRAVGAPIRAVQNIGADVSQGIGELFTSDADKEAQARKAGGFATSYNDPSYTQAEQAYAQSVGNPTLADMLARLRTQGERSNNGQVSSAGAQTPYQISPATRAGIMKQYGFDPWSSPQNAVRGAAIAATAYTGMGADYSNPQVMAKAAGGYFAGAKGAANPFGSASDGNNTTGQYTERVLGSNTPLSAPFLNAFDPRYDKAALAQVDAAEKGLNTPFSVSTNVGPAPQLAKPEPVPEADFTAADQALANMRPTEITDKEKMRIQRADFFKGIGQAMASAPGNEGVGALLMRIGGGALAGKGAALEQIHTEQNKFDDEMAKYNAAVYNNDIFKADAHQRAMAQTVAQNNQFNLENWKVAYDRWSKNGNIDISGTNAIISQTDANGLKTVRTIPIAGAVTAAMAQLRAGIFEHASGEQTGANTQVTGMQNAIVGRAAIMTMMKGAGGGQESDAAAAMGPAYYGSFIATHGLAGDFLGPDVAKNLEKDITGRLQQQQLMPGSQQWVAAHDNMLATELAKIGLADPAMMRKMMQVGAVANSFSALSAVTKARTSTSTDSRGMPSTRTSEPAWSGNAADLFSTDQ